VDSLSVRVVVDSAYDRFIADAAHPVVRIEHVRHIPGHERSTLAGEWGLSLHLESARGGEKSQYLLDFGFTPEVLTRNFALLDLDPGRLDGLILSHGHRDHYGGLEGFVVKHRPRLRDDIELYTGGESAFREKWIKRRGADPVSWGALDRGAIEAARVGTQCCDAARALAGPFTTGRIPRVSFERILDSTLVVPEDGAGFDHFTEAERLGRLVPDQHPDEHATCYVVQGRGLVVISSCGHVGLINSIKAAMAVSGVGKLHAVLGGFHLGPAPIDYVEHTVAELEALKPDVVVPMHCSGAKFIQAMQREMPDRLAPTNIGTRFTFGV
jgi:7,8-dihydropterin-6-yl-methyl-4-(beta-D-ribofuranosyl)aminobenzene 5'-phosphate synthase